MNVIPVEIVRPTKSSRDRLSLAIARILLMTLSVWIVMLTLGALTPWHLSYWETWLGIIAYRVLQVPDTYLAWTRAK